MTDDRTGLEPAPGGPASGPLGLRRPNGRPLPVWIEKGLVGATALLVGVGITSAVLMSANVIEPPWRHTPLPSDGEHALRSENQDGAFVADPGIQQAGEPTARSSSDATDDPRADAPSASDATSGGASPRRAATLATPTATAGGTEPIPTDTDGTLPTPGLEPAPEPTPTPTPTDPIDLPPPEPTDGPTIDPIDEPPLPDPIDDPPTDPTGGGDPGDDDPTDVVDDVVDDVGDVVDAVGDVLPPLGL